MGLDNFASIYKNREFLDDAAIDAFHAVGNICINEYGPGSFRGKSYTTIVHTITGYSLYDLNYPEDLREMTDKMTIFLQTLSIMDEKISILVNKINNREYLDYDRDEDYIEIDLRKYLQYCDHYSKDNYRISINELCGLRDFFRVCADNGLYLHASF